MPVVVAASLLTTGFVVAAAFLLWRQYVQQGEAVEGLRAAAQRRDASRARLQHEMDEVRTWAEHTLESLAATSKESPRRAQVRRHVGTCTWTEPSLFAVTDLDADKGSRRSRYAEHLVKVYGGSGDYTTACQGSSATRWVKQRTSVNVHQGCSDDPFIIYAVGAWPAHKVAEALAAGHDRYSERWYRPELATPDALDFYPQLLIADEARPA